MPGIQRTALVPPVPYQTPMFDPKTKTLTFPWKEWFQAVANACNAAPQITATIPATSASAGESGTIAFDSNWLYVAVGKDIWRRTALSAF